MMFQKCTNVAQLKDIDPKKPVLLAGECVVTFMNDKRSNKQQTYENYVRQPMVSHKASVWSRESVYVNYFVHPRAVDSLRKSTIYIALEEVIKWAYRQAKREPNLIVINSFENNGAVHSDVLVFTNGKLEFIEEIPGLPTSSTVYTRMLVDEITKRRRESYRHHSVKLVGDTNYIQTAGTVKEEAGLSTCFLEQSILGELSGKVNAFGLSPFKRPKRLVLVDAGDGEKSTVTPTLLVTMGILAVGFLPFKGVDIYKRSQFDGLVNEHKRILALSDSSSQNQSLLKLWQTRESYVRERRGSDLETSRLKLILQSISTASNVLPELGVNVQSVKHRSDGEFDFSIDVAARATDLETAIRTGRTLYSEIAGSMSNYAHNVVGMGAPRRQMINGRSYYVYTFTGNYSQGKG